MGKIKLLLGLVIYKLSRIHKNRFVFTSFDGHYSDNTKYISRQLHSVDGNADIIWLVRPECFSLVPDYAKCVDIDSIKTFFYRGTATAQIDNVFGFRAIFRTSDSVWETAKHKIYTFLSNKKGQPIFATMHGTALKKSGRDQINNFVIDMDGPNTFLLLGDQHTANILSHLTFNKMHTEVLGSPRNDILFSKNIEADIRTKLGLPNDKKIVLYAPTFRNDGRDVEGKNVYRSGIDQLAAIDFEVLSNALSEKFGGDWVMVCRFHYHVSEMVDWEMLERRYPGKFINGNLHDDMAEYLLCSDVLITDSSSSMFDFALTYKPCFLFFPDLENYRERERGLYMNIEELPFPLAVDFSTLVVRINEFDADAYENDVKQLLIKIGSQNDGKASERVVNYILEKCR